ncbi:ParB/Srx family N-terminal domain-containing protein [Sphingobium sp. WW5]|uniref:ParB/Srx family N-terminal domain-containing protein n=1 Tax=unclassified Sphingobium TaxID=2611147 RepID=UPI003C28219A
MTIQTIQLNKLALSDLNVRKVKPKEIEALAADIQARGVLQNLIGYDEDGKIKICAGGRRYRALKLLQKAKTIPGTFEVPVEIRSKDEALEISLAENAQREDMLGHVSRLSFDRKNKRMVCLFQAARSAYPKSWRRAAWNKHLRGGCGIVPLAIGGDESVTRTPLGLSARLSAPHI